MKAIARELPALSCRGTTLSRDVPLSRFSILEIRRTVLAERVVESVGVSTIWRWLDQDALRPWRHHPWIFPRDPDYAEKAGRVLDLYQGVWGGASLGPNDYVISADEKTSIQARHRRHPTQPPGAGRAIRVEHEYRRGGAVVYLAALDVFGGRLMGHVSPYSGIAPFNALKAIRPFVGAKNPTDKTPVFICPGAEPAKKPQYMPTAMSSTAMLVSQLVLNKGMSKMRNPARTFFTQENWCLMNAFWYEPEGSGDTYSQWHTWTASNSSEWSGTPREHYNNLHEQGGNLTACDGHAEYRKNRQTSSLDFGLVDAAQRRDSPYQPTEAHSRATYSYR